MNTLRALPYLNAFVEVWLFSTNRAIVRVACLNFGFWGFVKF